MGEITLRRAVGVALAGLLASGAWAAPDEYPLRVTGDFVRFVETPKRAAFARGNVRAEYRGLTVTAHELSADLDANTAVFKGRVVLSARGGDFEGETLFIDLDTRRWEFARAHSALPPKFFQGGVVAPLYLSSTAVTGVGEVVRAQAGAFTSCSLARPHYHIESRSVRIYPGRKLIARDVSFWVGGTRVLTLPWFWASLREPNRQPFVPRIGENAIEGRYLKTLFNYALSDEQWGRVRLDFMSERGFGKGVEHNITSSRGLTRLSLYHVANKASGETELIGRAGHEHQLAPDTTLRLASDYRQNSAYYLAGSTVTSNHLDLTKRTRRSLTTVSLDQNRSEGFTDIGNTTVGLRHERTGARATRGFNATYERHTTFPDQPDDQELNARLRLMERLRRVDLSLLANQRVDLDGDAYQGDDFYQVLERLPELVLHTDSQRLGMEHLRRLPTRLDLALGQFREQPSDLSAYRAYLGADASPRPWRLDSRTNLTTALRFRQTAYGDPDHTARYAYGGSANLRRRLAPHVTANAGYHLMESKGYTPFRFDYIGSYRTATAGLAYERGLRRRAALLTGFDVQTRRWQDLLLRVQTPLSRSVDLTGSTSYNFNEGQQRAMVAQARFGDHRTLWRLGVRYDPRISTWRRVTADLDWQATPHWRIHYLGGYDGLLHKFIYNEVLLVRDLHCWEARLYYSEQRDLVRFDLRIKAFEWGEGDFGSGRFGQRLDTSQAEPY